MLGQLVTQTEYGELIFSLSEEKVWSCTGLGDPEQGARAVDLVEYMNATMDGLNRVGHPVIAGADLLAKFKAFESIEILLPNQPTYKHRKKDAAQLVGNPVAQKGTTPHVLNR
jgi:hypothetical protein